MKVVSSITIKVNLYTFECKIDDSIKHRVTLFHGEGDVFSEGQKTFTGPDPSASAIMWLKTLAIGMRVSPERYAQLRGYLDMCDACMAFISCENGEAVDTSRYSCICTQKGDMTFTASTPSAGPCAAMSTIHVIINMNEVDAVDFFRNNIPKMVTLTLTPSIYIRRSMEGIDIVSGNVGVNLPITGNIFTAISNGIVHGMECYPFVKGKYTNSIGELLGTSVTDIRFVATGTIDDTRHLLGIYEPTGTYMPIAGSMKIECQLIPSDVVDYQQMEVPLDK